MTQNNGGVYNRRKRSLERQQKTVLKKTLKFESLLKLFSTQIPRNEQEKAYLIDYPIKIKQQNFLENLELI